MKRVGATPMKIPHSIFKEWELRLLWRGQYFSRLAMESIKRMNRIEAYIPFMDSIPRDSPISAHPRASLQCPILELYTPFLQDKVGRAPGFLVYARIEGARQVGSIESRTIPSARTQSAKRFTMGERCRMGDETQGRSDLG
ncbi:hypothetical protein RSAG8_08775, partial [Rhizoctonia solani AG-8 WAC10335]